jgi:hypothetical protein
MPSYLGLLTGQLKPDEAIAAGRICVQGDPGALKRLVRLCGLPGAHEALCAADEEAV